MPKRVVVELTDMAHGGDAVGRHKGQVVFVPLGLPGETVRVELVEQRKSYARGLLLDVLEPSGERKEPSCPYFGRCGGCQWQHATYEAQLRYKEGILYDQLVRIGKQESPIVHPMIGMDRPWDYRNHVQLRVDRRGRVGYYALKSHHIVPVECCPIAHPLLETMWDVLDRCSVSARQVSLRCGVNTGQKLAIIEGMGEALPDVTCDLPYSCLYLSSSGEPHLLSGRAFHEERLEGRTFRVSADAFFQNNTSQAERLIHVVQKALQLESDDTLLDAYCGVGTFGLSLVSEVGYLIGIEEWPSAVADARVNAGSDPVEFLVGEVADVLCERRPEADAVVLDPPRTGCTPEALEVLASCGATRIAYVSCDPATLARDIHRLNALGYRLVYAQPVDLFPQTFHIETVCLLERK